MPDMPDKSPTAATPPAHLSLAHPLDEFYAVAGQPLPPIGSIDGEGMPEPYKTLLVHQNDMTPTLEKHHRSGIHLKVLGRRRKEDWYFREVVLLLNGSNLPVEFDAIKINLALFPPVARDQILREELPLGHILEEHKIPHSSRPRAFLRLASDPLINDLLKLSGFAGALWPPQHPVGSAGALPCRNRGNFAPRRMKTKTDFDVLILGAGPAGSATAALLSEYGHRVLVLEPRKISPLPHWRVPAAVYLPAVAAPGLDRPDENVRVREKVQRAIRVALGPRQPAVLFL